MNLELNISLTYKNGHLTVNYNDGSDNEGYDIQNADQLPEKVKEIIQHEVDEFNHIENSMLTMTSNGCGCAGCSTPIEPGQKYVVCSDCGGMFCATCAHDGTFENHECEPDEMGDE